MLDLAEEAFDQITLEIKPLAEAWFSFAIGFGRNVGHCALRLDQVADAIGIAGFVGQNDGSRFEPAEQGIRCRPIMRLPSAKAKSHREAQRIYDGMDFGRGPSRE